EHARFPQQMDAMGTQDDGNYNLIDCVDAASATLDKVRNEQEQAEQRNKRVVEKIAAISGIYGQLLSAESQARINCAGGCLHNKESELQETETAIVGTLETDLSVLASKDYMNCESASAPGDACKAIDIAGKCTPKLVPPGTPTKSDVSCPATLTLEEIANY